jgi:tetratricopeptide (TPR) repeat protein
VGRADVAVVLPAVAILALDPGGLAPFGPLKWALVSTVVLASVAALRPAFPRQWLPFLAVAAVAAVAGVDPLYAWIGTPERHFGVLAWVLCAAAFACGQALDGERRRRVLWCSAGVAGVLGAWTAAEAVGWQPFHLVGAGDRAVGTMGSSAFLGAAAVLLLPIAATIPHRARWALGGLAATALVASGARAAWFGAAAVSVLAVALRRVRPAIVAGGVVVAVALALATGVAGRVGNVTTSADGGLRGRLDEWRVATRVVAHHPLLGVGPEGYRIDFAKHVDDDYERAHGRDPLPDRAHSAVLDVAATTGLLGLGAYLWLLAVVGRVLVRTLRTGPPMLAGAAAGVLAYWAQSLFLFPIAELEPVAWLVAGIVVGATARRSRPAAGVAVAAVAGVLAAAAFVAGALDVAADRAAQATLANGTRPTAAARLRPDAVRYRLFAAQAFEARGSLDQALRELEQAADMSPRDPVVKSERARLLLSLARLTDAPADLRAARTALERLAAADPSNAAAHLRLGVARALAGDQEGAERAWLRAEHLAPRSAAAPTDLALSYAEAGRWDEARAAARRALAIDPDNERARRVLEAEETDGT